MFQLVFNNKFPDYPSLATGFDAALKGLKTPGVGVALATALLASAPVSSTFFLALNSSKELCAFVVGLGVVGSAGPLVTVVAPFFGFSGAGGGLGLAVVMGLSLFFWSSCFLYCSKEVGFFGGTAGDFFWAVSGCLGAGLVGGVGSAGAFLKGLRGEIEKVTNCGEVWEMWGVVD